MIRNLLSTIALCAVLAFTVAELRAQPANTNLSNSLLFEGEPYLAMNPANPQNLVVAWMGFRLSGGQYRIAIKTRASFDGGSTWSTANALPHFGTGFGSADVSMGFDKNGLLYLAYIDYRQAPDSGGVYVARSLNGGLTWDNPTKAFDMYEVPAKRPVDRPWLVVDRSDSPRAGTLYLTTKPAPWIPPPNRNYYKVSSDSGRTWSAIAPVDGGAYLVGNLIQAPMAAPAVTAAGNFCAAYPSYVPSQLPLPAYYLATSRDRGKTFSYATIYSGLPAASDTNYKNGYQLLADPTDTNRLVLLFPLASAGDADIMAVQSSNGGRTWSQPVRINDDPTGNGKGQDMVWGAYNEKGRFVVTWRDRRAAGANGFWNAGYDFYYATSSDNGQTFSPNQKISSQFIAFDSLLAENGNDFMSCAFRGDTLFATWGDTRNGKMNIYFVKTNINTRTGITWSQLDGAEPDWRVFPNPGQDELCISFTTEPPQGARLVLFDQQGRRLLERAVQYPDMRLDVGFLPPGIYFLNIGNVVMRYVKV